MLVKHLGLVPYPDAYQAMQDFTLQRTTTTVDELWLCQHPPVFTQGLAGLASHVLNPSTIPIIATNRGGQVTYHGPGQIMAYPLLNLKRAGYFVKEYVYRLEESVIRTLAHFGVMRDTLSKSTCTDLKSRSYAPWLILVSRATVLPMPQVFT